MVPLAIDNLDDPRVAPYRKLKDRELARGGERFIAEGEHLVRRLLSSDFVVESVLLAERRAAEMAPIVPPSVPVYVAPGPLMHEIIGYKFHSGVIACGMRKAASELRAVIPPSGPLTMVVLPETANAENLGSLVRVSAAFGIDAMLLGERCCDPFWRQSIRVSMGAVFRMPIVQSVCLIDDLERLRADHGVVLAATVLDEDAEPLTSATRPERLALLFGNEAQGLDEIYVRMCQRRLTIPMKRGTDSLNVAMAAGVFLYHFTRDVLGSEGD